MEKNDGGSSSKGMADVQEQGESSAKRIKCSIEEAAFRCDVCTERLRPPIFQCPEGHLICSPCRGDLPEQTCTFGFGSGRCTAGNLARSLGMERAIESILVDCHYAEHGCTEKTAYSDHARHWLMCPHAPCECPEPGCDFAGKAAAELLDHLTAGTGHHKWPSTTFQYWVPFDLCIVEPGTHVLRCSNDGQLFLVIVQAAAEPPGLAVSLVCVQYLKPTGFKCSVSFSYSTRHRGTSTWEIRPLKIFGSRPRPIYVFVPNKVSDGPDDAGTVLTVNISCVDAVDEEDEQDDRSYVESDEDMAMSDEADDRGLFMDADKDPLVEGADTMLKIATQLLEKMKGNRDVNVLKDDVRGGRS